MVRDFVNKNNDCILVTVLVMVYNNAQFLSETIDSAVRQSYNNIEIFISDDCSSKNKEYLKEVIDKYSGKIRINLNNKNLGTVKHLNKIIKMSHGEIICPLSCGDQFSDCYAVQKIVDYFQSNSELICTAKRRCDFGAGKYVEFPNKKNVALFKNTKTLFEQMCINSFMSGACTYYKRELFEKYGYFDETYTLLEDWPYYLKLLNDGIAIGFIDDVTLIYQWGGVSTGKQINPLLAKDFRLLSENIWKKYGEVFVGWKRRVLKYRYLKSVEENSRKKIINKVLYMDAVIYLTIIAHKK